VSVAGRAVSGDIAIGPCARILTLPLYADAYSTDDPNILRHAASSAPLQSDDFFSRIVPISPASIRALRFWSDRSRWDSGRPIASTHPCLRPSATIASDASDTGWGLFLEIDTNAISSASASIIRSYADRHSRSYAVAVQILAHGIEVVGSFTPAECLASSTLREAWGLERGLLALLHILSACHLHFRIDSQALTFVLGGIVPTYSRESPQLSADVATLSYSSRFQGIYGGSPGAELQRVAESIVFALESADASYVVMWCPRCLNERADLLSHAADLERHSDFFLPLPLLQRLQHHWRLRFTLDLFATRRSARLPRYVTRFYDPFAVFHDAFSRFPDPEELCWIHPPYGIISLTLDFAAASRLRGVFIVPQWPRQLWYSRLLGPPGSRSPTPSRLGGPRFLLDAAPIGHAQDLLRFPPDTSSSLALPQGTLWALLVDFRLH